MQFQCDCTMTVTVISWKHYHLVSYHHQYNYFEPYVHYTEDQLHIFLILCD